MPTSRAAAVWEGKLRDGKGRYTAASGAFQGEYTFATRFEGARGTTPEELIAAAHAACLSMALAAGLDKAGTPATRIATDAACTLDKGEAGFRITQIALTVKGKVPGIDQAAFDKAAQGAKEGCPVSNLFKGNATSTLAAKLES